METCGNDDAHLLQLDTVGKMDYLKGIMYHIYGKRTFVDCYIFKGLVQSKSNSPMKYHFVSSNLAALMRCNKYEVTNVILSTMGNAIEL